MLVFDDLVMMYLGIFAGEVMTGMGVFLMAGLRKLKPRAVLLYKVDNWDGLYAVVSPKGAVHQ